MPKPLRLLIVEDSDSDAVLLRHALHTAGYAVTVWERVDTPEAMRAALTQQEWDLITSDHAMPRFSAPAALALAKTLCPQTPFIIVSGEINLNLAVALIRAGAQDYVQKLELARLGPAVDRALAETQLRRERWQAENELHRERETIARLVETSPVGIVMVNREGKITFANAQAEHILGLQRDEITQRTYNDPRWRITDYAGQPYPDDQLPFAYVMRTGQPVQNVRHAIAQPDGHRVALSINAAPLFDEHGSVAGIVATLYEIADISSAVEEKTREATETTSLSPEVVALWQSFWREWRLPVNTLSAYCHLLLTDHALQLDSAGQRSLERILLIADRLQAIAESTALGLQALTGPPHRERIDLSALATTLAQNLQLVEPQRRVEFTIAAHLHTIGEASLLRAVLNNLLRNAWEATRDCEVARIELGCASQLATERASTAEEASDVPPLVYYVRDNREVSTSPTAQDSAEEETQFNFRLLFTQYLLQRRHGGRLWIQSPTGGGTTVYFVL